MHIAAQAFFQGEREREREAHRGHEGLGLQAATDGDEGDRVGANAKGIDSAEGDAKEQLATLIARDAREREARTAIDESVERGRGAETVEIDAGDAQHGARQGWHRHVEAGDARRWKRRLHGAAPGAGREDGAASEKKERERANTHGTHTERDAPPMSVIVRHV